MLDPVRDPVANVEPTSLQRELESGEPSGLVGRAPTWLVQVRKVAGTHRQGGALLVSSFASLDSMLEVTGDATRGDEWACVRLVVDGDRIVEADADGLERSLVGLTLLEAAAVPGERLAADALANALGPVFRAGADPARTAVAMSGGVDSAVALLRAGPAAVGVTLRLWIDPKAPDSERACCSPEAVIAARETCHSLGIPHVTLDAREAFRRAIVAAVRRGLLPVARRQIRARAATAAFASRSSWNSPAAPAPPGLRPATTRASSSTAAGACSRARPTSGRTSRTCSPGSILVVWSESGSRSATRRRRRPAQRRSAPACRSHSRPESQEACFLGGGDYREFLERHGLPAREGAVVDEEGATVGAHQGFWRFTPGQRRGLGVAAGRPTYAIRSDPKTNTVVVGPARGARAPVGDGDRPPVCLGHAGRREAPLPLTGAPGRRRGDGRRVPLCGSTSLRTGSRPARRPSSTRKTSWSVPARSPRAPV